MTTKSIPSKYIEELELENPAEEGCIGEAECTLGIAFPQDYKLFIEQHDGAEGFVGKHGYLQLWPVGTIAPRNEAYCVRRFAPGLVIIGANGGEMAYAYDTRKPEMPIVEVPFIPMELGRVSFCAKDFVGFFEYLCHHG